MYRTPGLHETWSSQLLWSKLTGTRQVYRLQSAVLCERGPFEVVKDSCKQASALFKQTLGPRPTTRVSDPSPLAVSHNGSRSGKHHIAIRLGLLLACYGIAPPPSAATLSIGKGTTICPSTDFDSYLTAREDVEDVTSRPHPMNAFRSRHCLFQVLPLSGRRKASKEQHSIPRDETIKHDV